METKKPSDKTQRVRAPWFSGKEFYYRRPRPTDVEDISAEELQTRIDLAEASISARGQKNVRDGPPVSAVTVRERLTKEPEVQEDRLQRIRDVSREESEKLRRKLLELGLPGV